MIGGMRTAPLVGEKPWFGPRRFGWGLSPVSPEGWAVTALGVAGAVLLRKNDKARAASALGMALVAVAILKGTSPGGPKARAAFRASRAPANPTAGT